MRPPLGVGVSIYPSIYLHCKDQWFSELLLAQTPSVT
jgi:hypothetical protein